jgi:hypothetical protein
LSHIFFVLVLAHVKGLGFRGGLRTRLRVGATRQKETYYKAKETYYKAQLSALNRRHRV